MRARTLEPRVLLALVALTLAVGFCLFKAFQALTLEDEPSQDSPSPAFVLPAEAQITKRANVFAVRLPTDVLVAVLADSDDVGQAAVSFTLTTERLTALGLSFDAATQALAAVDQVEGQVVGREPRLDERDFKLASVEGEEAVVTAEALYLDPRGVTPPQSAELTLTWRSEDGWVSSRLSALTLTLSG